MNSVCSNTLVSQTLSGNNAMKDLGNLSFDPVDAYLCKILQWLA